MSDVLVVGGGVIGLSLAWRLAEQGASVTVVEQGEPGMGASWAGAGMLPPADLNVAATPFQKLRAVSHPLWADWSRQLQEKTGIDNGYRACGALEMVWEEEEATTVEKTLISEGANYQKLTKPYIHQFESAVSDEIPIALRIPEMAQVRNPRHIKSLVAACRQLNVKMVTGEPVIDFDQQGERITGIRTATQHLSADQYCLTTGAWSGAVGERLGWEVPVKPVRGQIVLLATERLPFTHILETGSQYLVPRPDGRILIGSTTEHVGFNKQNSVEGITSLLEFATRLVPALSQAQFETCWAGFRPGSEDGLPFLGKAEQFDNLFYAFGHYRDGLQQSSGTAVLMSELLQGQDTSIDLSPYSLSRVQATSNI